MGDDVQAYDQEITQKASDVLISHWQLGTTFKVLPEPLNPGSIAEGYMIQSHVERLTRSKLWGWKIAATSIHGQQHINVDRPLAGRILEERVTPYGEPVSLGFNRMLVAELEFAFKLGRDLEPREFGVWEMEEVIIGCKRPDQILQTVMDACDGLFLGIEIPDSRYDDFVKIGAAGLIADNACADKYVLGPEVKEWRSRDLVNHEIKGWVEGREHETMQIGNGGNVLGDPKIAMTWIANELSRYGVPMKKGQYVTTGTCVVPLAIKPGDRIIGDYGDMGKIVVDFVI